MEPEIVEAPLSAGPPPLFDVTSFSKWVTDVFTEEYDDEVLDKLAAMDASDDMAKMRLLLNEEVAARRNRLDGDPILKSYTPPEEGAGSRDVMVIAFAGENDHLVRAHAPASATPPARAAVRAASPPRVGAPPSPRRPRAPPPPRGDGLSSGPGSLAPALIPLRRGRSRARRRPWLISLSLSL